MKNKYIIALGILGFFLVITPIVGFVVPQATLEGALMTTKNTREFSGTITDVTVDGDEVAIDIAEYKETLVCVRSYISQEELALLQPGKKIKCRIAMAWLTSSVPIPKIPCTALSCEGVEIITLDDVNREHVESFDDVHLGATIFEILFFIGTVFVVVKLIRINNAEKKSQITERAADLGAYLPVVPVKDKKGQDVLYYEDRKAWTIVALVLTVLFYAVAVFFLLVKLIPLDTKFTVEQPIVSAVFYALMGSGMLFLCITLYKYRITITNTALTVQALFLYRTFPLSEITNFGYKKSGPGRKKYTIYIVTTKGNYQFDTFKDKAIMQLLKPIVMANKERESS